MQHIDKCCIFLSITSARCPQVLGRSSPFPLILLPQFGGYWIEGTNHEPKDPQEADQPPCPASHIKLETNSTAKIYRKNFMGKVRVGGTDGEPGFGNNHCFTKLALGMSSCNDCQKLTIIDVFSKTVTVYQKKKSNKNAPAQQFTHGIDLGLWG